MKRDGGSATTGDVGSYNRLGESCNRRVESYNRPQCIGESWNQRQEKLQPASRFATMDAATTPTTGAALASNDAKVVTPFAGTIISFCYYRREICYIYHKQSCMVLDRQTFFLLKPATSGAATTQRGCWNHCRRKLEPVSFLLQPMKWC